MHVHWEARAEFWTGKEHDQTYILILLWLPHRKWMGKGQNGSKKEVLG